MEKIDVLSSLNTNSYDLAEQYVVQSKRTSEGRQKYAINYCWKKKKKKKKKRKCNGRCDNMFWPVVSVL